MVKVVLSLGLINKVLRHGGVWEIGGIATPFFISALDENEWLASRLGRFISVPIG
jgi:hypothetical protein